MHDRAKAAGAFGAIVEEVEREAPLGDAIEQPAVEQLYAAEEEGCDLTLAAPPRHPQGIEKIVAAALVADRIGGALEEEHRVHPRRVEGGGEADEGVILAVEPQDIAIDDEKAFSEQWQGARHPAAGFEQLVLLGDLDARMIARGEPGGHHVRLVVD